MAKAAMTVIRGGRVVDIRGHAAPKADILIAGDTIVEIGKPGMPAPSTAKVIDAKGSMATPTATATWPRAWATARRSSCC
jgi:5-methylthioadenosine/S-adenosylhomocysteine deaminase